MRARARILSAIALTALVGVLTAPAAQAQQVEEPTDYQRVARRYYHTRHVHRRAPVATPAPVVAAPVHAAPIAAHAPVVAAPVHAPAPAPAPVAPAPVVTPAPSPVIERPTPVAATPAPTAPAPRTTPLPVRPTRPLVMAADHAYPGGGWKILVGFAGLGLALFLWKRRAPASTLAAGCEIQVLTRTSIGGKCELLVVDVGGQRMLLGATSGSVQYLAAIDGNEPSPSGDADKTAGFESMFAAARSRTREKVSEARPREAVSERPRETSRPTLNTQSLRADSQVRRSPAPEGQVAGLLALGAYR